MQHAYITLIQSNFIYMKRIFNQFNKATLTLPLISTYFNLVEELISTSLHCFSRYHW
jgi:hypothetical protein